MPEVLDPGAYFGREIRARNHAGFSLKLTRYGADERLPVHTHELPYVCFVLEGGFLERCGAAELECLEGAAVIHGGGAPHSDRFGAAGGVCLNIAWDALTGAALVRRSGRALPKGSWHTKRVRELGAELAALTLSRSRPAAGVLLERMSELAEELFHEDAGVRARSREPAWLARIENEMDERPSAALDVHALARSAGVHRTTLLRAFWRHRGSSVSEALRRRRLDRAVRDIKGTRTALAELALRLGFADQSHLCRALRAATGTTPARLRRSGPRADAASCVQEVPPEPS